MRPSVITSAAALSVCALAGAACEGDMTGSGAGEPPGESPDGSADRDDVSEEGDGPEGERDASGELDDYFREAAAEFNVPEELLKAVSYVETGWTMVEGHEEFEGAAPSFGLMALGGDRLDEAAELAGESKDAVRTDELANLRAGAALLAERADAQGIDRDDLDAWTEAVALASGIEHDEAADQYVARVYEILAEGVAVEDDSGEQRVSLVPVDVDVAPSLYSITPAAAPDHPAAVWRPSPNKNARPAGARGDPSMVIVHTCEGNYAGCWGWLTDSRAGASAHYVVSEDGGEISQLVEERERAWHIAANYDCGRNDGANCDKNGYSTNDFSLGIEHAGFASQSSFPLGQVDASAQLACGMSQRHGIPIDRFHFVGHGQLQPWNRTDPGPNWPWTEYLNRVSAHCDGGSLIIDSNNGNNNTDQAYVEVSANWHASNNVPGYYGSGYWYAGTEATSDPASFWFHMPEAGKKTAYAWWSAASDRSGSAPFIAYDAAGREVGRAFVDQRSRGGQWVKLGEFQFTAGWNKILLSRWTNDGNVVIADAIKVE